jgi:hypothetical protein
MGLDMYLSKRTYVWSEDRDKLRIEGLAAPVDPTKVKYILEDAGYWRKANAIHRWFVEQVQDGNDDCGVYMVSREQLAELLATVERVLEASDLVDGEVTTGYRYRDGKEEPIVQQGKVIKDATMARELLPTQAGFFFGGTAYGQGYVDDLQETRRILTEALADPDAEEFEYGSSW